MQARSAVHDVFVKDYVSCLSMPGRHTLEVSGASAPTLLRGRGRDGKRLARGDAETACRAAVVEPTHIRDLEDEVGVQLLERTPKSVRLTDAGRAFLDEERAILKHTDDAVQKVRVIGGDASTAADALRTAEDNRADLVLMDIQLDGGISGVAAAAAIRGHLMFRLCF